MAFRNVEQEYPGASSFSSTIQPARRPSRARDGASISVLNVGTISGAGHLSFYDAEDGEACSAAREPPADSKVRAR